MSYLEVDSFHYMMTSVSISSTSSLSNQYALSDIGFVLHIYLLSSVVALWRAGDGRKGFSFSAECADSITMITIILIAEQIINKSVSYHHTWELIKET